MFAICIYGSSGTRRGRGGKGRREVAGIFLDIENSIRASCASHARVHTCDNFVLINVIIAGNVSTAHLIYRDIHARACSVERFGALSAHFSSYNGAPGRAAFLIVRFYFVAPRPTRIPAHDYSNFTTCVTPVRRVTVNIHRNNA